jgi:hypothetical protein
MKRLFATSLLVLALVGLARGQDAFVTMHEKGGAYTVQGHFFVAAPNYIAWNVLTDYDHISNFVSSMEKSCVQQRTEHKLLVEQKASGKFFLFSRSADVLLDIHEEAPSALRFRDISHKDFYHYVGFWKIEEVREGILVLYQLEMKSRVKVPQFIRRRVVRKGVAQLLEQVRSEMIKRNKKLRSGGN